MNRKDIERAQQLLEQRQRHQPTNEGRIEALQFQLDRYATHERRRLDKQHGITGMPEAEEKLLRRYLKYLQR